MEQAEKEKKAEEEKEEYESKLPKAIRKYLSAGRQVGDLTCKEIRAIALCVYSEKIPKSKRKGEHISALKRFIASNPSKMAAAEAQASESDQVDSDENSEDDEDEEEEEEEAAGTVEPDYKEEYYGKRVAKYHFEDRGRLCFGTVVNSGFPKKGPRKKYMHWTVEFDEDDAAVYGGGERGQDEDLEYGELVDAFELYKEKEEEDVNKPSASNQ